MLFFYRMITITVILILVKTTHPASILKPIIIATVLKDGKEKTAVCPGYSATILLVMMVSNINLSDFISYV